MKVETKKKEIGLERIHSKMEIGMLAYQLNMFVLKV